MRRGLVLMSLDTGLPLSDLLTWHPRDLATAMEFVEARRDAQKDAERRARNGTGGV